LHLRKDLAQDDQFASHPCISTFGGSLTVNGHEGSLHLEEAGFCISNKMLSSSIDERCLPSPHKRLSVVKGRWCVGSYKALGWL
jgi:hypothetical protein